MYKVEKIGRKKYKVTGGRQCSCGWKVEYSQGCEKRNLEATSSYMTERVNREYEEHIKDKQHIRHKKLERVLDDNKDS